MPRQRERTTALPKPRPRPVAAAKGRFAWSEQHTRLSILGATALLLLGVLGVFAYRIYESNVLRPASTVLNVDGSKVSLGYFAARLGPFAIQNQQSSSDISVLSENLLTKLERELIVEKLARDMNLPLDDKRLTEFIATGFGVPVGPSGSSFDVLYRNQLRTLQISNSDYRRLRRAELADDELAKQIESQLGEKGEQFTLRVILANSQETATNLLGRIRQGEDFGTVAQKESLDLESRQQDGILPPEPLELFPESIRAAITGKPQGELLGPIKVQENWWVIKIEVKEEADYTVTQKTQLAEARREALVKAKRAELAGKIRRNFDAADLRWAAAHAKAGENPSGAVRP